MGPETHFYADASQLAVLFKEMGLFKHAQVELVWREMAARFAEAVSEKTIGIAIRLY